MGWQGQQEELWGGSRGGNSRKEQSGGWDVSREEGKGGMGSGDLQGKGPVTLVHENEMK